MFFMMAVLKMSLKNHTSFSWAVFAQSFKPADPKLIRQPPQFCITCNDLQWPPVVSNPMPDLN
jgi:hypothetical protein